MVAISLFKKNQLISYLLPSLRGSKSTCKHPVQVVEITFGFCSNWKFHSNWKFYLLKLQMSHFGLKMKASSCQALWWSAWPFEDLSWIHPQFPSWLVTILLELTLKLIIKLPFLAYVIVFYIHGDDYPAFGAATTLSWSWMWPLLVRYSFSLLVQ